MSGDDFPDEIHVWRGTTALKHCGTWSTTRYPEDAITYHRVVPAASSEDVRAGALKEAAALCAEMAEQIADAALTGLPEQARIRESMEAAFTKARHRILALIPGEKP